MGSAFRTWFNQIPGNDPIEQQQVGVMQAILLALMAITVLGIPISLSDPLVTLIDVVLLGLLAVAQRAQRRGAFRLGIRLAVGVMIVAIGLRCRPIPNNRALERIRPSLWLSTVLFRWQRISSYGCTEGYSCPLELHQQTIA